MKGSKKTREKVMGMMMAFVMSVTLSSGMNSLTVHAADESMQSVEVMSEVDTTAYDHVVLIFSELPEAGSVTEETTEEQKAAWRTSLTEAYDAYDALDDEDYAKFNTEQFELLQKADDLGKALSNIEDTPETYDGNPIDVDITWGSMEFSYDGSAWTCDTDANKITAENKGTKWVSVYPSFQGKGTTDNTAITSTITGSFTRISDSDTISPTQTYTTKLNITGGAINANVDNIGTVKIKIEQCL